MSRASHDVAPNKNGTYSAMRSRELYGDDKVFLPGPYTVDIWIHDTLFRLICSRIMNSKYVHVDLARIIGSPLAIEPLANINDLCRTLQASLENILTTPVKTITPDLLDLEGK